MVSIVGRGGDDMKLDGHIGRIKSYLEGSDSVKRGDVKHSIEKVGKAMRRGDMQAQNFVRELGANAQRISASQLSPVSKYLQREGLLPEGAANAPESLSPGSQTSVDGKARPPRQSRSSWFGLGKPRPSSTDSTPTVELLIRTESSASPSVVRRTENKQPALRPPTQEEIIAAANKSHSIQWNPEYPGIFIQPPAEGPVEFFDKVSAALNEIKGGVTGFAKLPSGEALLRGISAQYLMYPDENKKVVLALATDSNPLAERTMAVTLDVDFYVDADGKEKSRPPKNEIYATPASDSKGDFLRPSAGSGAVVYLKKDNAAGTIYHELTHAFHIVHGNVYGGGSDGDPAPGVRNATGLHATEEVRTTGFGVYVGEAISEASGQLEADGTPEQHYGANYGYNVPRWESSSAASDASRAALRKDADAGFLHNEGQRLSDHVENYKERRRTDTSRETVSQGLAWKREAQVEMYSEAMRLYKNERYGAAFHLVKNFPKDMLHHLSAPSKEPLQIQNLCSMVINRYREVVQEKMAGIRFDVLSEDYYTRLRDVRVDPNNAHLSSDEVIQLAFDYIRGLQDYFHEGGATGDAFVDYLAAKLKSTPDEARATFEELMTNFRDNRAAIDELFKFQADRSEAIMNDFIDNIVMANTPDSELADKT